ncbi:MAG TPA: hypothetical protein DGH68_13115, partial [Bacteroidetes bacterium]|nr:hypothetical protein [Bacteroidota bacterium]
QAARAWDIHHGNSSVVIGVLDSGVDTSHPDLYGNLWTDPATGKHGRNFVPMYCYPPPCPVDTNAIQPTINTHGTGIAGLAAAVTNNVTGISGLTGGWYPQRGASIMVVRITNEDGALTYDQAVGGVRWAVDHGANVINCSWWVGLPSDPDTFAVLRATVNHAISLGAVVVASAGNIYHPGDPDSVSILPVPARWPEVIAVASTDSLDIKATTSFYTANYDVDVAAPSVDVLTTQISGYTTRQGTSFAAAYVSGLLALVKSVAPTLANPENAVFKTAEKVGGYEYVDLDSIGSRSRKLGYGRINAFKALAYANGNPTTPQGLSWSGAVGQHPTFVWDANPGLDIAGYNIFKDNQRLNDSLLTSPSYTDTTETVPEHRGGVVHYYCVSTVDVVELESQRSNRVSFEEGRGVEKRQIHGRISSAQWSYLSLGQYAIEAITVDPNYNNTLFVGAHYQNLGFQGRVFRSLDGGQSWDTVLSVIPYAIAVEVPFHRPNALYVTFGNVHRNEPMIMKSTTSGNVWDTVYTGWDETWNARSLAIDPKYSDTLYCGVTGFFPGGLDKTTNGGMTWSAADSGITATDVGTAIAIDPDSTNIMYCGTGIPGIIFKSTNGGRSWLSVFSLWNSGSVLLLRIDPHNSSVLFALGGGGAPPVARSTNKGLSWQMLSFDTMGVSGLNCVVFDPGQRDRCFGGADNIYVSEDGGIHWQPLNPPIPGISGYIKTLSIAPDGSSLYAAVIGTGQGMYRLDLLTRIERSESIPSELALYQNYPNPFNPSTTIRYALPRTSFVTLKIYNTLGQQVAQLVDEQQQAGNHHVMFRGEGLASGVYFYRLQTGGFVANRKILLLR